MNRGSDPSIDDRFTAFADSSRRTVLSTLCEQSSEGPPTASIDTLTTELEPDDGHDRLADGGSAAEQNSPTSAQVELVHVHLPTLERAGLIERDQDQERVRLTVEPGVVEHGLELAEEFEQTR